MGVDPREDGREGAVTGRVFFTFFIILMLFTLIFFSVSVIFIAAILLFLTINIKINRNLIAKQKYRKPNIIAFLVFYGYLK